MARDAHRQRGSTQPISMLSPTSLIPWQLLASAHRPAEPAHRQQPRTRARRPDTARRPGAEAFAHSPPLPSTSTRLPSAYGPCRLGRSQQPAKKPLLCRPALHLGPRSAAKIRHPAHIAAADFVHLHDSNAELIKGSYANSAMGRGPEDSAAPATASLAAAQQQKPKTVSGGEWRPAGRRARGDNTVNAHQDRRGWRRGRRFLRPWSQHQHPRQVSHQRGPGGGSGSSGTA